MHTIQIRNALIVSQNSSRSVFRGSIFIEGDQIKEVKPPAEEYGADEVVDASNLMAIPGLINTHCHVAMTHLRGLIDDIPLSGFLEKTFRLDAQRTDEGMYNSSLLGTKEMINSGITSFLDLYYGEDIVARAAKASGIRAFLAWNTLDQDKTTQKGNPVKNAEHFIQEFRDEKMITPAIGVQGVYVAGDETYLAADDVSRKYGTLIHGHLSETREEVYNFVREHGGKRPIEHLSEIGFLSDRFIAAHCVWATLNEVKLMSRNGSRVSWNPVSNAKLGVGGTAPVPEFMSNGVLVSLGSDSTASNNSQDIWSAMKFGSIGVKNERWNPAVTSAQMILDMATVNAAQSLNRSDLGSIEPGKTADITLLDMSSPEMIPTTPENAVSNIVYSAGTSSVSDVIIGGKFVKRNHRLLDFDPEMFRNANFY